MQSDVRCGILRVGWWKVTWPSVGALGAGTHGNVSPGRQSVRPPVLAAEPQGPERSLGASSCSTSLHLMQTHDSSSAINTSV